MKRYVALLVLLASATLAAQQAPPAKPTTPPGAPAPPAAPAAPKPPAPPEPEGQAINVRVDVSVLDQEANGTSQPKTVMVMLADRATGRTRAVFEERAISVDANPRVMNGRIRLYLTIQSQGITTTPNARSSPMMHWQNSFTLMLESAKPMLAFETIDPVTKRKLSIEVKATIQK